MTKLILLVEDNASDEKLTKLALKTCGVANQVVVARDGAEALDFLFATDPPLGHAPGLPAVVLLDLNLPKIDGLEVLRCIRENSATKTLPVVILTSSKQEEDIAAGYAFGANAYVRKPVDYAAFIEAAKALGVFWLLLNETGPS